MHNMYLQFRPDSNEIFSPLINRNSLCFDFNLKLGYHTQDFDQAGVNVFMHMSTSFHHLDQHQEAAGKWTMSPPFACNDIANPFLDPEPAESLDNPGGHCTSNVTVYKDISRSDGHVDKSNNQIYQIVALEN